MDARPDWSDQETGPGWQDPHRMVDGEDRGHRAKTSSVLPVSGDWTRKEDVHLQRGQGVPVLQVRRLGTPSRRLHRREP